MRTARFEQMPKFSDYSEISFLLSLRIKVESSSMLVSGWVSPLTSYFDFLLLMESLTVLASLKRCPPGSRDTHQEGLKSRRTGEVESCQLHIGGH